MKLRNKLILSCAALAAVATTAVSTTYAWYTSNKTVTASNIIGASADAGDKMLLIADGLDSTGEAVAVSDLAWYTNISNVNEKQPADGMTPLSFNTSKALQVLDKTTSKTKTGTTDADGYLHFVLYLRNAGAGDAKVSMTLTAMQNITGDATGAAPVLPTKTVIKGTGWTNPLSVSALANYKIDATRVLALDLTSDTVNGTTTTTENAYQLAKGSYATDDSSTATDAVSYYNEVMEATLDDTDDASKGTTAFASTITVNTALGTTAAPFATVPADTDGSKYVKLDFKIYLDGWNALCYDACQGQDFKFALSFTALE